MRRRQKSRKKAEKTMPGLPLVRAVALLPFPFAQFFVFGRVTGTQSSSPSCHAHLVPAPSPKQPPADASRELSSSLGDIQGSPVLGCKHPAGKTR